MIQNSNMIQNTKMVAECADSLNENSMINRAERIYCKQKQLQNRLLEINNALIGSDVFNTPEVNAICVMEYLDETESIINCTLDLACGILEKLR